MIKILVKMAIILVPFSLTAQNNNTTMSTYIAPNAGVTIQGAINTEQTGTAHKRGSYNEFDTDFDLQVKVIGESKSTLGYNYGLTYGSVWKKEGRKLSPGFEIDIFHNNTSHECNLANPNTEIASNVVGPNRDSVLALVEDHFGAEHHTFKNTMTIASWNAAANLTLSYEFSPKISVNGALGIGFSAISLKEAESLQSSPAPEDPGFETTKDNGGGIVNHFNSQPNASNNLMFGQFRLGTKIELAKNLALRIDARGMYTGAGDFIFGSTKYTDHAPTDNWTYKVDQIATYTLTAGLCIYL